MVRTLLAVALVAGSLVFAVQGVGSASTQVDDPYATSTTRRTPPSQPPDCDRTPRRPGCETTTTTTTQRDCRPLIELSRTSGAPGARVVVTVDTRCFPPGTVLSFTFNGQRVGSLVVGAGDGTASIAFDVPSVPGGAYPVCVLSDVSEPACENFTVVAGAAFGRGTGSAGGGSLTGATGGFGRTGLALLPWLTAAAAAITLGLGLKRPGRFLRRRTT